MTVNRPFELPGNKSAWLPSFDQKRFGGGLPVTAQDNLATPFNEAVMSLGTI